MVLDLVLKLKGLQTMYTLQERSYPFRIGMAIYWTFSRSCGLDSLSRARTNHNWVINHNFHVWPHWPDSVLKFSLLSTELGGGLV